jgi:hypothetical protein
VIGRVGAVLVAGALALTACGSGRSGLPGDTECGHSSKGVVCVAVVTDASGVGDVIGYFSPATALAGRTWRLDLLRYGCDPGGTACRPAAQYPAAARRSPPPVDGSCIAVLYDSGRRQCTSRLAQAMATHGDWAKLPTLPSTTFAAHGWLCVSAQVARPDGWHDQFARSAACVRR